MQAIPKTKQFVPIRVCQVNIGIWLGLWRNNHILNSSNQFTIAPNKNFSSVLQYKQINYKYTQMHYLVQTGGMVGRGIRKWCFKFPSIKHNLWTPTKQKWALLKEKLYIWNNLPCIIWRSRRQNNTVGCKQPSPAKHF